MATMFISSKIHKLEEISAAFEALDFRKKRNGCVLYLKEFNGYYDLYEILINLVYPDDDRYTYFFEDFFRIFVPEEIEIFEKFGIDKNSKEFLSITEFLDKNKEFLDQYIKEFCVFVIKMNNPWSKEVCKEFMEKFNSFPFFMGNYESDEQRLMEKLNG